MTDIEQKALALLNEVAVEMDGHPVHVTINRDYHAQEALCRAIEQHEAFKQEVSDAVEIVMNMYPAHIPSRHLSRFIIPKTKPDPLVEVIKAMQAEPTTYVTSEVYANRINAALDALGFEIREKGQ